MVIRINRANLRILIIILLIIQISVMYSQEDILFRNYDVLRPTINLFEIDDFKYNDRILLFIKPLGGLTANKQILVYSTRKGIIRILSREDLKFNPSSIQKSFFDPKSNNTYIYLSNSDEKSDYSKGWYKLIIRSDYSIDLLLQSTNKYWANNSNPIQAISKNKLLQIEYTKIDALQMISKFSILKNNKELWKTEYKGQSFSDMYVVSEQWLLNVDTPHIAGIWNNDTIINYVTEDTLSFKPEQIIGYGEGVVITSLKTDNGFSGISIWSVNNELLFRDNSFSITKMIKDTYPNVSSGVPIIYMTYFSYPFVICNLGRASGIGIPFCALVLDLVTGKTFYSPETYNLLAIF